MKKLILLFSVFFCINTNAAVTLTVNKTIGCSPLVVRYIDVTVHPFPVVSRTWTFGNSFPPLSGGDTMTTFYDSVKCYSPKLKVCYSNGSCDSTTNNNMVCVSSLPILSFRAIDSLGCMKSGGSHTVNFTNTSVAACGTINFMFTELKKGNTSLLFIDSATNAATGGNFSYTFNDTGTYYLNVTAKNTCGCLTDTTFKSIVKIYRTPNAKFDGLPLSTCDTVITTQFTNKSDTGSANYTATWTYGDGSPDFTGVNPSRTYYKTNSPYTVKLLIAEKFNNNLLTCYDSIVKPNYISCKKTIASFTAPAVTTVCQGESLTFTNTSDLGYTGVNWDYGNGSGLNSSNSYTYPSAGTYTVKMIVTYPGGCNDTVTKVNVVTINPSPKAAFRVSDSLFCAPPRTVSFTNQSTGFTSSNWTFTNGTPATSASASPSGISFSATGGAKLVISNAFGCKDSLTKSGYINFSGITSSFVPSSTSGCVTDVFTFLNTSLGLAGDSIVSHKWDFNNDSIYDSITTSKKPVDWQYPIVGCKKVKLEITTQSGCIASSTNTICVGTRPTANFTISDTAPCIYQQVQFPYTGTLPITKSNWYVRFPKVTGSPIVLDSLFATLATSSYTDTGTYYPMLVAEYYGCKDTANKDFSKKVSVFGPKSGFTTNINCLVSRKKVDFTNGSVNATSQLWDFGVTTSTTDTSTALNPSFIYPDSGCFQVKLITYNSISNCYDTAQKLVCTYLPSLSFTITDSITCVGKAFNACNTTLPAGSTSNVTFQFFETGNTLGVNDTRSGAAACHSFIYYTLGYKNIRMITTDQNGCIDSFFKTNAVLLAKPDAKMNVTDTIVCINQVFSATETTTYSSRPKKQIEWVFDGGSPIYTTSSNFSSATPGDLHLVMTSIDSAGCNAVIDTIVHVVDPFVASFTKNRDSVCPGQTITFTNASPNPLLTYKWTFPTGIPDTFTGANPPNVSFTSNGTKIIRLIVQSGITGYNCADTVYDTVHIYTPKASFTQDKYVATCSATFVTFTDNSIGSNIVNHFWDFGEGLGMQAGSTSMFNKYDVPNVYKVCHIVETVFGCRDTICKDTGFLITGVFSSVSYKYLDSCGTGKIEFILRTENASKVQVVNFGSITPSDIVTHDTTCGIPGKPNCVDTFKISFFNPGTYTPFIIVDDRGGCPPRVLPQNYPDVSVYTPPKAKIGVSDTFICKHETIDFNDSTTYPQTRLRNEWTLFGNPSNSSNQSVSSKYDVAGNYNVKLFVEDSVHCVDSIIQKIIVNDKPIADFNIADNCLGDSSRFKDISTLTPNNKNWWHYGLTAGDTSIKVDGGLIYANPGTYTVTLQIEDVNSCKDTVQKVINIYAPPKADFDSSGFCVGVPTNFNNKSVAGTNPFGGVYSNWDLDNPPSSASSVASPSTTYTTAGNKNVKLVVTDTKGCMDSITKIVPIYGSPFAKFGALPAKTCFGVPIVFTDSSIPSSAPIITWDWDLDGIAPLDGNGPTIPPYSYKVAGNYLPKLNIVDANGCKSSQQISVLIRNKPIVNFTYNPQTCIDTLIDFNNTSPSASDIVAWTWNFGELPLPYVDAQTLDTKYAFPKDGSYTVTLIGVDNIGCKDTVQYAVKIDAPPLLKHDPAAPDTSICFGASVLVKVSGAQNYSWKGNPFLKKISGDTVVLISPPVNLLVRYAGTNGVCPEQEDSFLIRVVDKLDLNITAAVTKIISGQEIKLKANIKGVFDSLTWAPNSRISCLDCIEPKVTPITTTTYKADIVYSNLKGYQCRNSDSITIFVSDSCSEKNITMPNAFTPSAASNNKFFVMGPALSEVKFFRIFDRWGNIIFEKFNLIANDPNYGWDGRQQNSDKEMESGVYIYQIGVECTNGNLLTISRDVTLLR